LCRIAGISALGGFLAVVLLGLIVDYQQAEILRRLGCTVGQGFLFARPMPADEVLTLLRDDAQPMQEGEEDMLAVLSAGRG
jgi:predicted signal transduction protein with EAL and GGDEF domain